MSQDDLTPTDEQVRRLLADARHTAPMPDDVAARLDEVIAGLGAPGEPAPKPVDQIGAARRRRTARNWLLAAAAAVVVGVGINQVDLSGMSSSDDSAASDGGGSVPAAEAEGGDADAADEQAAREVLRPWRRARANLTSAGFGDQVERLQVVRGSAASLESGGMAYESDLTDGAQADDLAVVCDVGKLGSGTVLPVRYDGERAWLVFRRAAGETQVVDLYLCGSDDPTRSITLPTD